MRLDLRSAPLARLTPIVRSALVALLLPGAVLAGPSCQGTQPATETTATAEAAPSEQDLRDLALADWNPGVPEELFEVVRVVDGDTIHIQRQGEVQKLRLLSVDTEEKLTGRASSGGSKPETVYGQASADWAVRFFDELSEGDEPTRVGLLFPDGVERRDVYGRVLCHVVLPDGTDFNLLLVALGRSPYFNKYGNSLICHAAFRAAQKRARAASLGVWDPETNAAVGDAPAVRRPYDQLLPWWEARARAVDAYRAAADTDAAVGDAEVPDSMAKLLTKDVDRVRIFGSVFRVFREDDGSATLLFRTGVRERAFRARIDADSVDDFDLAGIESSTDEFRQNYLWVTGSLRPDRDGFDMQLTDPQQLVPAGPEPDALEER